MGYKWKVYGFCSKHGLGSCKCLKKADKPTKKEKAFMRLMLFGKLNG